MIEKEYKLSASNEKAIEKLYLTKPSLPPHMVFNKVRGFSCRSTYPIQTCI